MPDRIEMGTIACAAAITNGEVLLRHGRLECRRACPHRSWR
jgi:UDP-N-acetylglucosamine enolpyruvyl transferase